MLIVRSQGLYEAFLCLRHPGPSSLVIATFHHALSEPGAHPSRNMLTEIRYSNLMVDKPVLSMALAQTNPSDLCLLFWALDSVFFVVSLEIAAGTSLILARSSILGLVLGRRCSHRDSRNGDLGD